MNLPEDIKKDILAIGGYAFLERVEKSSEFWLAAWLAAGATEAGFMRQFRQSMRRGPDPFETPKGEQ